MIDKIIEILWLEKYQNIRKIPKNTFYKALDFSKTNEKIFTNDIENIFIISAINKNNINILDYKTDELNYSEIYYLFVSLKSDKKISDINKIIHTIIPNPVVLILNYKDNIIFSTAKKRINKNDKTKQVIERYFITEKIDVNYLINTDKEFLDDIYLTKNSFENFFRFYMDISSKIIIFNLVNIRGWYKKTSLENIDKLILKIDDIKKIEWEIALLESEYKNEIAMWPKAILHSKIVKKKDEIRNIEEEIKNI